MSYMTSISETSHLKKAKKNGAGEGNRTLATSLEGWGSTIELHPQNKNGRSSRIRTCDPLVPSQMRYQTALCPVIRYFAIIANPMVDVNHYYHREHHETRISVTKFIISPTKKTDKYFYVKFYKFINKNRNRIATLRSYTISIFIIILITLES